MFKKILTAVDIEDPDTMKQVLDVAVRLASSDQAQLRLASVRYMLEESLPYLPKDVFAEEEKHTLKELGKLAAETGLPSDRVSTASPIGTIYDQILEEAGAYNADLIVVGAHRPDMAAYLLGSNAARIVRHATCSVLVVR